MPEGRSTASATRSLTSAAGVQGSVIKRIAGHEDGAVTFSVYGSHSPLRGMADALRHTPLSAHALVVTESTKTTNSCIDKSNMLHCCKWVNG